MRAPGEKQSHRLACFGTRNGATTQAFGSSTWQYRRTVARAPPGRVLLFSTGAAAIVRSTDMPGCAVVGARQGQHTGTHNWLLGWVLLRHFDVSVSHELIVVRIIHDWEPPTGQKCRSTLVMSLHITQQKKPQTAVWCPRGGKKRGDTAAARSRRQLAATNPSIVSARTASTLVVKRSPHLADTTVVELKKFRNPKKKQVPNATCARYFEDAGRTLDPVSTLRDRKLEKEMQ